MELIYDEIQKNGYKTQRELRSTDTIPDIPTHFANVFPEYDEITVDVGRDGTLIWKNGQHRLTIAKLLDLDTVLFVFDSDTSSGNENGTRFGTILLLCPGTSGGIPISNDYWNTVIADDAAWGITTDLLRPTRTLNL